ncbi:MAG: hypothetical protein P1U37_08835 [Minwuia sp.]|nr:hypothetical protein [Minwuia sp.]
MKPLPVLIIVPVLALLLALPAATPAHAQLGSLWRAITGQDEGPKPDKGFGPFREEARRIEDALNCGRVVEQANDAFSDLRRHCILGDNRTVRVTIVEPVGHEGLTKRVRLTWTDNGTGEQRALSAPAHVDRSAAQAALSGLAALFVPEKSDHLIDLFTGGTDGAFESGPFSVSVVHQSRAGLDLRTVELRDGNYEALAESEARSARPGFDRCLFIVRNIDVLKNLEIDGEPRPQRSDLHLTYFLHAKRGDRFLCELHDSGYYRIRISQKDGEEFRTLAHGNIR